MTAWTTPKDVEAKVRRRWKSGALLRAHALDEPFDPIAVPLRRPTSAELAERLDDARRWAATIARAADGGRRFDVENTSVGGRAIGRSTIPGRAVVRSYDQAWRLLGVRDEVRRFDRVLAASANVRPVHEWVLAHPIRAAGLADEWLAILAARDWLDWHRGSGLYLRQVDAPGVDTKLIERHRGILAALLDAPSSVVEFTRSLGYAVKPNRVRMRFDPALLGVPDVMTEAEFRLDELTRMDVDPAHALIVENEISYLSLPVPQRGVVLYGKGYDAAGPASLEWLRPASARGAVTYWGDIDTHGFRILDRVRAHLPDVRSILMDRDTLLRHEERWGHETAPSDAPLPRVTRDEAALYADLVSDRYGPSIRLEQERIDWAWVMRQVEIAYGPTSARPLPSIRTDIDLNAERRLDD